MGVYMIFVVKFFLFTISFASHNAVNAELSNRFKDNLTCTEDAQSNSELGDLPAVPAESSTGHCYRGYEYVPMGDLLESNQPEYQFELNKTIAHLSNVLSTLVNTSKQSLSLIYHSARIQEESGGILVRERAFALSSCIKKAYPTIDVQAKQLLELSGRKKDFKTDAEHQKALWELMIQQPVVSDLEIHPEESGRGLIRYQCHQEMAFLALASIEEEFGSVVAERVAIHFHQTYKKIKGKKKPEQVRPRTLRVAAENLISYPLSGIVPQGGIVLYDRPCGDEALPELKAKPKKKKTKKSSKANKKKSIDSVLDLLSKEEVDLTSLEKAINELDEKTKQKLFIKTINSMQHSRFNFKAIPKGNYYNEHFQKNQMSIEILMKNAAQAIIQMRMQKALK